MANCWAVVVSCLLLSFSSAEAKRGHPLPTYFKRIDSDGFMLDVRDQRNRINFMHPIQKYFTADATLKVSPSLVENGATVNVSWSGIPKPNKTDFIAFYCPKDDISSHYLDYIYATESSTYASGYGWIQVVVYNLRTSCEFRYYQKPYIHLATSNLLEFKGGIYAPLQGHIALTGDPTQMRVMWVSGTGKYFYFLFSSLLTVYIIFYFARTYTHKLVSSGIKPAGGGEDSPQLVQIARLVILR